MNPKGISTLFAAAVCAVAVVAPANAVAGSSGDTVWLCKPGAQPNPCRASLETTVFSSAGASQVENPPNAKRPKIDCFYVYPTVSEQGAINADLSVDPQQTAIAQYQASRFSRRCRVYAPVYRQLTLASISEATEEQLIAGAQLAYSDVLAAWREYLRSYNRGRGVVLIGHSQGTYMLRYLIRNQIDDRPGVRRRLVSALLLGGNVAVREGERKGGDFARIRSCAKPKQTRCVIGFSAFNATPPPDARFGLPNGAFDDAFELPAAPTPWVGPQDHYSGQCVRAGGAHVLMASPIDGAKQLTPSPDATWGLHLADVNIALGDLVGVVGSQARAYVKAQRKNR